MKALILDMAEAMTKDKSMQENSAKVLQGALSPLRPPPIAPNASRNAALTPSCSTLNGLMATAQVHCVVRSPGDKWSPTTTTGLLCSKRLC